MIKNKALKFINAILLISLCIFLYLYFNEVGIFFLENILLIDISAVVLASKAATKSVLAKKTFLSIIQKIGYKKFFFSVFWVLFKRYVIESFTNYFKKHSLKRFKNNLIEVLKLKVEAMKNSSFSKKIIAIASFFTGSAVVYFVLTNFLTKIIVGILQKLFYALVLIFWSFFALIFSFIFFVLTSILQIFFLIKIINYIEQFTFIKKIYAFINYVFKKILAFFDFFLGTKLHLSLIKMSRNLDEYFASILDKNFTLYERIQRKRDRYINGIELISVQRQKYRLKKEEQNKNLIKYYDKKVRKYLKKQKTWREKREEHFLKLEEKKALRNKRKRKRTIRKSKLLLLDKTKTHL